MLFCLRQSCWLGAVLFGLLASSCGGGDNEEPASARGSDDTQESRPCKSDSDCDDQVFCNGIEVCGPLGDAPGLRCLPAQTSCLKGQICDEATDACVTACEVTADADSDGSIAKECGGNDCDDSDALRYPGNVEVCDSADRDEDCDPNTYGFRDQDNDGVVDNRCCNVDENGVRNCGEDCNDSNRGVHPNTTEACDGVDNDCDGEIDEEVERDFYVDRDGDGYGSRTAEAVTGPCTEQEGLSPFPTDCDDSDENVYPGAPEICDGVDTNCDGSGVEDLDNDGHVDINALCFETEDSLPVDDCADDDPGRHPGLDEVCDGVDQDCDGVVDNREVTDLLCNGDPTVYASICAAGQCNRIACEPFRGSCNDDDSDGCEVDFKTDPLHCGNCNARCAPGAECLEGICEKVLPVDVQQMTGGCVLFNNGHVACWGDELVGGIEPKEVPELDDALAVRVGRGFACALRESGELVCWGERDNKGRLGDGVTSGRSYQPVTVVDELGAPIEGVTTFELRDVGCALAGKQMYCWGDNGAARNQIPNWETETSHSPAAIAIDWTDPGGAPLGEVVDFGRDEPQCVVVDGGEVRCWGSNTNGQLGIGATSAGTNEPTLVPGLSGVAQLAGRGGVARCGLRQDGSLWCWGIRVGNGVDEIVPSPVQVGAEFDDIETLSGGLCFLREDGEAYCWGRNLDSMGNGETRGETVLAPSPAAMGYRFDALDSSCGITKSLQVVCWGSNGGGRLGTGDTLDRSTPSPVQGFSRLANVVVGNDHSCALHVDGTASCWGSNFLGVNGTEQGGAEPRPVLELTNAVALDADRLNTCALLADDQMKCWGHNGLGQLGMGAVGSQAERPVSVELNGIEVIEFDTGHRRMCVTDRDHQVYCVGDNRLGQLGREDTMAGVLGAPVETKDGSPLDQVAAQKGSCAIRRDGTVWCWGNDETGALGDGEGDSTRFHAAQVPGIDDALDIQVDDDRSVCVLRAGNTLSCWGANSRAQLGDLRRSQRDLPYSTDLGVSFTSLVEHGFGTSFCGRDRDQLYCWGDNQDYVLGTSAGQWSASPVINTHLPGLVEASVGSHGCGLTANGELYCWGANEGGQCGVPGPDAQNIPVRVVF